MNFKWQLHNCTTTPEGVVTLHHVNPNTVGQYNDATNEVWFNPENDVDSFKWIMDYTNLKDGNCTGDVSFTFHILFKLKEIERYVNESYCLTISHDLNGSINLSEGYLEETIDDPDYNLTYEENLQDIYTHPNGIFEMIFSQENRTFDILLNDVSLFEINTNETPMFIDMTCSISSLIQNDLRVHVRDTQFTTRS